MFREKKKSRQVLLVRQEYRWQSSNGENDILIIIDKFKKES